MQTDAPIDWRKHKGLARRCVNELIEARPWVLRYTTAKNLYHEHLQILTNCAKTFDPSMGNEFSTHAMPAMRKKRDQIINAAQGLRRWDLKPGRLSDLRGQIRPTPRSPIESMMILDRDKILREAISTLIDRDRDILHCVMVNGETGQSYAHRCGVTKQMISQRKHMITKHLRARLAESGITEMNQLGAA